MKSLFFGGVHPDGHKDLSAGVPLAAMALPAQAAVLLSQHIGAPCQPLVAVGDTVCLGQKIGDGDGLCVPVHAPVSGVVTGIEDRPHPGGGTCPAILIKNDFLDTPCPTLKPYSHPQALSTAELVSIIREAGIVGMGGAAFPTDVKSKTGMSRTDTLILNACECEPYITADDVLLRTRPADVLRGVEIVARILSPGRVVIALEDNKAQAAEVLKQQLKDFPGMELKVLPTRSPRGRKSSSSRRRPGGRCPPAACPRTWAARCSTRPPPPRCTGRSMRECPSLSALSPSPAKG